MKKEEIKKIIESKKDITFSDLTRIIQEAKRKALNDEVQENKRRKYSTTESEGKPSQEILKDLWVSIRNEKNSILELKKGEETLTDPQDIANALHEHFINIGSEMRKNIPKCEEEYFYRSDNIKEYFEKAKVKEVQKIIADLKKDATPGPDGITTGIAQFLLGSIKNPITELVNKILDTSIFPSELKESIIKPIFKDGDKTDPSNYRPISLTNTFAKVVEKVLDKQIHKFIAKETCGFDKNQFAYQKKCSTDLTAIEFCNNLYDCYQKGGFTAAVFIDISKAFDTVDHDMLIKKLQQFGFGEKCCKLFRNYLSGREARTKVGDNFSEPLTVNTGVPQGAILGNTLFLLYVHNISMLPLKGHYTMYADDTAIVYNHSDKTKLENIIKDDLKTITHWAHANLLSINEEKTKYILFQAENSDISLDLDGVRREKKKKYLGLYLDENLKWTHHVNKIIEKIKSRIEILKRINETKSPIFDNIEAFMDTDEFWTKSELFTDVQTEDDNIFQKYYIQFVREPINRFIIVWSQCSNDDRQRIQAIMNEAIRAIWRVEESDEDQLFSNYCKDLKLSDFILLEKLKFIYIVTNKLMKTNLNIDKMISNNSPLISKEKKDFDSLPENVRNTKNTKDFISGAKEFIVAKQRKFIPASQRPDGTWRKARRVRDGYVPQEEVPLYESKGKQIAKQPHLPVGMCPLVAAAAKEKREKELKKKNKVNPPPGIIVLPKNSIDSSNLKTTQIEVKAIPDSSNSITDKKAPKCKSNSNENVKLKQNDSQQHEETKQKQAMTKNSVNDETKNTIDAIENLEIEEKQAISKQLKKLRKKAREIEAIEAKIKSGELKKPEKDQLEKIRRKKQISKEIKELERRQQEFQQEDTLEQN